MSFNVGDKVKVKLPVGDYLATIIGRFEGLQYDWWARIQYPGGHSIDVPCRDSELEMVG